MRRAGSFGALAAVNEVGGRGRGGEVGGGGVEAIAGLGYSSRLSAVPIWVGLDHAFGSLIV